MKLVFEKTGEEVTVGTVTTTSRGESVVVTGMTPPHKPGSTGKVYVKYSPDDIFGSEYYPSVIGAKWVEGTKTVSKKTFTKGPWRVTKTIGGTPAVEAAGDTHFSVCIIKRSDPEMWANANLIAAAPELLEGGENAHDLLERIVHILGNYRNDPLFNDRLNAWTKDAIGKSDKLAAAITKAKGE